MTPADTPDQLPGNSDQVAASSSESRDLLLDRSLGSPEDDIAEHANIPIAARDQYGDEQAQAQLKALSGDISKKPQSPTSQDTALGYTAAPPTRAIDSPTWAPGSQRNASILPQRNEDVPPQTPAENQEQTLSDDHDNHTKVLNSWAHVSDDDAINSSRHGSRYINGGKSSPHNESGQHQPSIEDLQGSGNDESGDDESGIPTLQQPMSQPVVNSVGHIPEHTDSPLSTQHQQYPDIQSQTDIPVESGNEETGTHTSQEPSSDQPFIYPVKSAQDWDVSSSPSFPSHLQQHEENGQSQTETLSGESGDERGILSSKEVLSDQPLKSPDQTAGRLSSLIPATSAVSLAPQPNEDSQGKVEKYSGNDANGTKFPISWEAVLDDDDDDFLAEDSEDLLPGSSAGSSPESPSSFLASLDDDAGIQDNNDLSLLHESRPPRITSIPVNEDQGGQNAIRQASNPYAPHQPSSSDLAQMSPTTYGNLGFSRPSLPPMNFGQDSLQGQLQRPSASTKAQSFVDQSQDGYKSPYDLPMDLSKPRRRIQMHQVLSAASVPTTSARSNSVTTDQRPRPSAGQFQPLLSSANPTARRQDLPSSVAQVSSVDRRVSVEDSNPLKTKATSSNFFEELPTTARSRPPTAQGRYTPAQVGGPSPHIPIASAGVQQPFTASHMPSPPVPNHPSSTESYSQYQLQRPERVDPYANVPLVQGAALVIPNTRYSPAPPASQTAPSPSRYSPAPPSSYMGPPPSAPSRYSPAPPSQSNTMQTQNRYGIQPQQTPQSSSYNSMPPNRHPSQPMPPVANALPFQPRTSSPLAYHGKRSDLRSDGSQQTDERRATSPQRRAHPPQRVPPPRQSPPSSASPVVDQEFIPPRRSQTQSPGRGAPVLSSIATSTETVQRPASVHGPSSPVTSAPAFQSFPPARPTVRQRGISQHLNFILPVDESQHDDLQRWRGSPIFRFGLAGSLLTSFPKHIPRYAPGSSLPMVKAMAGEVRLRNAKDVLSIPDHVAKFPGPLRSKSKKKEVLAWLSERITVMEGTQVPAYSQSLPDTVKTHEERLLLWKVVRVIVEHDGAVDGNIEVQRAMNLVLSPESLGPQTLSPTHNVAGTDISGICKPVGTTNNLGNVNTAALESVRRGLLQGQREQAVWTAVDNHLWAHAMLLSSTLDRSIWKQVAHEFVRQEVKLTGTNTDSLAALYEIFAGNLEESVDELVPPSARAGFQMVSRVEGTGPTKSVLDGLDRWRETLALVLNNRSPNDQKALAALGLLLATYGRIEASHICYLFAASPILPSIFGGADDAQTSIVLLGADHRNQPAEFFLDDDAILLTEVYEFASSILASNSKSALMPHLQAFKLQRAKSLVETGLRTQAQAYCDAMGSSLRSTTKLSTYYHPQFLAELDDVTQRLSQAPTETSSWMSKPTMGKVSDSVWNKFTTFVAGGEESDAASNGSGKDNGNDSGPFAKVSGTPGASRPGSSSDLYNSYSGAASQPVPNTTASAKYAPSGQFSARSSSDLARGRPSTDSQRSLSYIPQTSIQRSPYDPTESFNQQNYMAPLVPTNPVSPYVPVGTSTLQANQATPPQSSYMSMVQPGTQISSYQPHLPQPYVSTPPPEQSEMYMPMSSSTASTRPFNSESQQPSAFGNYQPAEIRSNSPDHMSSDVTPLQSYSSYEPPATNYVPYQPEPSSDSDSETRRSKKKPSFLNDSDDVIPSSNSEAAATTAARRKANDAATEAAFLAAAAADSAKDKSTSSTDDKTLKPKPSWFGSLFARKESDSLDATKNSNSPGKGNSSGGSADSGSGQKVIRAKLGEESSFYYDKELKKWVNKKDPASMQPSVRATPPPPKGPVGRVVSESLGGGSTSPALVGGGGPPRSAGMAPPPPMSPTTGPTWSSSSRPASSNSPPSRVMTPAENSSSSRPAAAASDVASQSALSAPPPTTRPTSSSTISDIDDLLGGPPTAGGRKAAAAAAGGTVKARKARGAGRYVDVMAK